MSAAQRRDRRQQLVVNFPNLLSSLTRLRHGAVFPGRLQLNSDWVAYSNVQFKKR